MLNPKRSERFITHAERRGYNPLNLTPYILNPERPEQFIMHAERDYNITALIVEDFCCLGAAPDQIL